MDKEANGLNGHTRPCVRTYEKLSSIKMKTSLAELAEELDTTDRTLRRAVHEGLLHANRPSPRTLDLPIPERVYARRSWPLLSNLREALRTEPTVSMAVLFGSRARGDDHSLSDVDLLVRLRRGADPHELAARLSARVGHRVQAVMLDDARQKPLLLAEIVREGRVLTDRDEVWPALLAQRPRIERAARRERRRIDDRFAAAFAT
jgi:predicted nucleotidyltransferase